MSTETERETEETAEDEEGSSPDAFLVSVVVAIAALVCVEVFFRGSLLDQKLRKDSNYITSKALDYEPQGGDVVVTGDSRMFHAVIPYVMRDVLKEKKGYPYETYNFAIPAGTTPTFLMVATEVVRHHPRPRVFVIGLNPASFSCCDTVSSVGTSAGVRWPMVPWLVRATWRDNVEEAGASVAYGASRLLATRAELAYAVSIFTLPTPPINFQDRGWNSLGGRVPPEQQDKRAKGRAGAYAELMDKSKGAKLKPMASRYFTLTLELLKKAGIKPVVIGAPQARQLDYFHDEAHTYFEYLNEVKRITTEQGVPFVDLNAPPGIESTDFTDCDHLSEPGATIFTRYLASEVVAPLLP
ncbi:hypothetical protein BH11MYX4_BH11MYX4_18890 [soil metagenome]